MCSFFNALIEDAEFAEYFDRRGEIEQIKEMISKTDDLVELLGLCAELKTRCKRELAKLRM